MNAPIRIKLSRAKGWRMPANTMKVDRSTRWGNPLVTGKHGTRAECVQWFRWAMGGDQPCHADVLLEIANQ